MQAIVAGLIAWAVAGLLDASAPLALLAGLACVILVRAAINANNFAMSRRFGSAVPLEHQLDFTRRLRLFAEEFRASMLATSWLLPRGAPSTRIYPGSRVPPVLLLHGYGCNSGYWTQLVRLLDRERISHASIDLEPLTASIDDYVQPVAAAVDALCAQARAEQVLIVAHSMGGLVARAYLRTHGERRIAHVYTLGSPHHGTALANFGPGRNAEQMRRLDGGNNAWLAQLAASETPATRALITSIYTHHDNIVAPQDSGFLPGARNIDIGGVGHVALASNARVLTLLMGELAMWRTAQNNVWQR